MLTRPRLRSHTGCVPCKKRRKKCDEQKPTCAACQRVERRCFWVPDDGNATAYMPVKCSDPVFEYFIRRLRQEPTLSKSIDLSAFQDRICASHVLETCFKSANLPFDRINTQRNGWSIQSTLTFGPIGESLAWDCFLAHGEMFVGNRYKHRDIFEAGLIKYAILVKKMRVVIENENTRCSCDTLAAISNLETFSATRSWSGHCGSAHESIGVVHAAGMLAILETMQPQQFQDDSALALFENTRFTKILVAILLGRETPLTSEPWKTVPWARAKHAKDSMHRLIDLLCEIVSLQSELHILTPYQGLDLNLSASKVQKKVRTLLSQLCYWRQSVELKLRSCLGAKKQATNLATQSTCNSSSIHPDLGISLCELGVFNMILIYLCRLLREGSPSMKTAGIPADDTNKRISPETKLASRMRLLNLPIEDPSERAHVAAKEVALIWEAMLSNDLNGIATVYLGMPMHVARELLAYKGDEAFTGLNIGLDRMPDFWAGTG